MRHLLLAALLLGGCPAPQRYAIERPGLDCNRATRVVYRTMLVIGYTVTDLVPASPERPGMVAGTKVAPDGGTLTGRVRIACDARGAQLQPVEDALLPNYEFSRLFDYSFKTLVQQPEGDQPWKAAGLQVLVQTLDPFAARLDLGGAPTQGGAVPVRITVRNDTDRAVKVDPADVELVTPEGQSATPLSGPGLDAALTEDPAAARVRAEQLARERIPGHTTIVRFLVYPPGRYREARLAIEDVETGESEGFVTPVQ